MDNQGFLSSTPNGSITVAPDHVGELATEKVWRNVVAEVEVVHLRNGEIILTVVDQEDGTTFRVRGKAPPLSYNALSMMGPKNE